MTETVSGRGDGQRNRSDQSIDFAANLPFGNRRLAPPAGRGPGPAVISVRARRDEVNDTMLRSVLLCALAATAAGCDSLSVLPSARVDGLGGMYGKNADRHRTEVRLSRTGRRHRPTTRRHADRGPTVACQLRP